MEKLAYILHGTCDEEEYFSNKYPSPSNSHWLPWLQNQLLIQGYSCQTPEIPNSYKSYYNDWENHFKIYPTNAETVLIGHSAGAGFFLKWLSKNPQHIKKLVMVAPFMDPKNIYADFLQCTLLDNLEKYINEIHIFYSTDDDIEGVKETVDILLDKYPSIKLHKFTDKLHFCLNDMGTDVFPELLKAI
jgi:hypothetical protein